VPTQVCPQGRRVYGPLGVLPPTTAIGTKAWILPGPPRVEPGDAVRARLSMVPRPSGDVLPRLLQCTGLTWIDVLHHLRVGDGGLEPPACSV
jgi:hypothetical protein